MDGKSKSADPTNELSVAAVRIALLKRGWNTRDLAERMGMKFQSLTTMLGRGTLGPQNRARLESAFDYQEPIWSTARDLLLRQACRAATGVDPATLNFRELTVFARAVGARITSRDNYAALLENCLQAVAANASTFKLTQKPKCPQQT